jgi:excisionase family DNA binding protein
MKTSAKDSLVSVREAAQLCGRNMETVRRWIWAGKLPAQKLGNQLFIKKSALDNYCRETATKQYQAEKKEDFLERAIALRNRIRARGVKPIDAAKLIRQMREERMNELEQSLR